MKGARILDVARFFISELNMYRAGQLQALINLGLIKTAYTIVELAALGGIPLSVAGGAAADSENSLRPSNILTATGAGLAANIATTLGAEAGIAALNRRVPGMRPGVLKNTANFIRKHEWPILAGAGMSAMPIGGYAAAKGLKALREPNQSE